jgi:hypothetical protein
VLGYLRRLARAILLIFGAALLLGVIVDVTSARPSPPRHHSGHTVDRSPFAGLACPSWCDLSNALLAWHRTLVAVTTATPEWWNDGSLSQTPERQAQENALAKVFNHAPPS